MQYTSHLKEKVTTPPLFVMTSRAVKGVDIDMTIEVKVMIGTQDSSF
jgi:hypothetical protein